MASCDTVLAEVTNSTSLIPVTVAPGDSLTVRAFSPPSQAFLEDVITMGGQAVTVRVTSPFLHDTTRGLTFTDAQGPSQLLLPRWASQPLSTQDTLGVQLNSGAANSSIVALLNYYTDLGASNARLFNWGDVSGLIENIKPVEVDCVCSATIGVWSDTSLTATENLLKANTDYAVLGYQVDVGIGVIAIRGQDTGGLRVGAPGTPLQNMTQEYFVEKSLKTGRPHILVINAANANNTVVSVANNSASTAVKVQLILAELSQNLSG